MRSTFRFLSISRNLVWYVKIWIYFWKIAVWNVGCVFVYLNWFSKNVGSVFPWFCGGHIYNFRLWLRSSFKKNQKDQMEIEVDGEVNIRNAKQQLEIKCDSKLTFTMHLKDLSKRLVWKCMYKGQLHHICQYLTELYSGPSIRRT